MFILFAAMVLDSLSAISPLDGRYFRQLSGLSAYFSEYALIRYRLLVEVEYLIALSALGLPQLPDYSDELADALRGIYVQFDQPFAEAVKQKEAVTNHDVKALEYVLREKIEQTAELSAEQKTQLSPFVHFALTSQDVNNTAIPLSLKAFLKDVYLPLLDDLVDLLTEKVDEWGRYPMLSHTHGQPASPTTVGKEIGVFVERLENQRELLESLTVPAKFGGAVGNFNAHYAAYPHIDWPNFADDFVNNQLGLKRGQLTTQIEHYDGLAAIFDAVRRINVILIDLSRDCWTYISMDYFKLKINPNEVGSSTMPHKVNPIDFENAEGNFGFADAIFDHLSNKLPVSRLQRDLTDSTVLRNLGVPFGHTVLAFNSLIKGLKKLEANETKLAADLDAQWAILAEPIQTILKREGIANAYEQLKALTRAGHAVTKDSLAQFIAGLSVNDSVKAELLALSPQTYLGFVGRN